MSSRQQPDRVTAGLDWKSVQRLAVFPYRHRLTLTASLQSDGLTIATTVHAGDGPVPVSFGFHPYMGVPGLPRADWRLSLPAMRRLILDPAGIPTGTDETFVALEQPLGARDYDDGFALLGNEASFAIAGGGRRIGVELLDGYTHAQVFAPSTMDFIAIEPMTAPANALISGDGLRLVVPDATFSAVFRITVGPDA